MATTAQFTSIRVVCNNTLAIALKSGSGIVKVPHSTVFDAQKVKKELGISISAWDNFMYEMKTLSERRVNTNEVNAFINNVFNDPKTTKNTGANERAKNKVLSLFNGHGKGADLLSSKNTAFGLLNAVTEFVDHERKARNTDYRLDSAWFGQGANTKGKSLDQALYLVA